MIPKAQGNLGRCLWFHGLFHSCFAVCP